MMTPQEKAEQLVFESVEIIKKIAPLLGRTHEEQTFKAAKEIATNTVKYVKEYVTGIENNEYWNDVTEQIKTVGDPVEPTETDSEEN
jgi:hypothetical protein